MLIRLTEDLFHYLIVYSQGVLPQEACGVILGHHDEEDVLHATTFLPLPNIAEQPAREFIIDPLDMLPYLKPGPSALIGIFHSHPSAPPIPSYQDMQTMWHNIASHWIMSLQSPTAPELLIYEIKKAPTTEYHKLSFVIG